MTKENRTLIAALGFNLFINSACAVLVSVFLLAIVSMLGLYGIKIPNGMTQNPEHIVIGFGLAAIVCCFIGLLIIEKFSEVGTPTDKKDELKELETATGNETGS
jgi:hypothetical protein